MNAPSLFDETTPSPAAPSPTVPIFTARVIGEPKTQGSTRAFMPKGGRFPVVTHDSKKLMPWRNAMASTFVQATSGISRPIFSGPVEVEVDVILPRLKTMPKTVKGAKRWPTGKSDLDKHQRAVGDALKDATILCDDGQICAWKSLKRYAEIGEPPGVLVSVKAIF
jgi:Holliday junction resolvase RusA-like endonuclease